MLPDKFDFKRVLCWLSCYLIAGFAQADSSDYSHLPNGRQVSEQGFPGNLDVVVNYLLNNDNQLVTTVKATTDKATVVSLIRHDCRNLGGHDSGTILDDEVQIFAEEVTEVTDELISTGGFVPVAGTPVDFRTPKPIGQDVAYFYGKAGRPPGYDHNFVIPGELGTMCKVAVVLRSAVTNPAFSTTSEVIRMAHLSEKAVMLIRPTKASTWRRRNSRTLQILTTSQMSCSAPARLVNTS